MLACSLSKDVVDHVIDWLKKEPWAQRWSEFQDATLETIAARRGLTLDAIDESVSENSTEGILFGILFEHFLEIEFEASPHNIVAHYVQRRGWKEARAGKSYLQSLQETPFSLYKVVAVNPGHSMTVQDLIRPLPPVEVLEVKGSQHVMTLHYLMLKVLEIDGQFYCSGSIMMIPDHVIFPLMAQVKEDCKAEGLSLSANNYPEEANGIHSVLHRHGIDLLTEAIGYLVSPLPRVVNAEGDSILLTDIHIPVKDTERVIAVLEAHPEFERADIEVEENLFWNWIQLNSDKKSNNPRLLEDALLFKTDLLLADGRMASVRGNLELTSPKKLHCTLMSKERGEALLALLISLLGSAIGKPVMSHQALEKAMSQREQLADTSKNSLQLSPEETQEIMQAFLEQHYKDLLDTVIPILEGTPREIAKTKKGKIAVANWLRYLQEGQELSASSDLPRYDFNWMWETLGVTHLKHTETLPRP